MEAFAGDNRACASLPLRLALPPLLAVGRGLGVLPMWLYNRIMDWLMFPLLGLCCRLLMARHFSCFKASGCPMEAEWIVLTAGTTTCRTGAAACKAEEARERNHDAVILYIHGGAFLTRCPSGYAFAMAVLPRMAARLEASETVPSILAVNYSLPACAEDTLAELGAVLSWLASAGRRVLVAGDSAGAHLAVQLALRPAVATDPGIAGVVGLCPWLDLTLTAPSVAENRHQGQLSARWLHAGRAAFLRKALAAGMPFKEATEVLSAVRADLSTLHEDSVFLVCGARDTLRDDGALFMSQAPAKAVTSFVVDDGVVGVHGMLVFLRSPAADEALSRVVDYCARRLWRQ